MTQRKQPHSTEMRIANENKCSIDEARRIIIRTSSRPGEVALARARRRFSAKPQAERPQNSTPNRFWYDDL